MKINADRLPGARRLAILQQERSNAPHPDLRYATAAAIPDAALRAHILGRFVGQNHDISTATPVTLSTADQLRVGVRVRQEFWAADEWYVVAKVTSEGVYLNDHNDEFVDYPYPSDADWVVHPDDVSPFRVGRWIKRKWFSNWYKITEVDHDNRKFALVDSDGRLRGWQSMDEPDPAEKWVFKED